jgi:hypothetical protein
MDSTREQDGGRWCVHIPGPDDLYPMRSKEEAERVAREHNEVVVPPLTAKWKENPNYPSAESITAVVVEWPHRRNSQWRDLRDNNPAAFAEAVALERKLSAADSQGGVFLHRDLVPLDEVDLDDEKPEQEDLLADAAQCDSGYCFV